MPTIAALSAWLLAIAATANGQERALRDSLDVLREEFIRGYNTGNIAALERLYVNDAARMVYDVPAQRGRAEIVEALRRSFSGRRADVQLALLPEEVHLVGDMAMERGSYHEVWKPLSGGSPYIETGKYVTLARRDDGWKYAWSIFNRDSAPPRRALPPARPGALSGRSVSPARWEPWGVGLEMAVLDGDPSVADRAYTIALRLAPGRWIRPHWHPRAKQVYVVSGTLLFGHGPAFDTASSTALQPGTIAVVPAEHPHFEGAQGETVILLSGIGPLQTTMIPAQRQTPPEPEDSARLEPGWPQSPVVVRRPPLRRPL
jgi:ketosteroid isomerase-like protein/mannose-6-phosphate isomerase-like protein (cupin superfamily)